EVEDVLERRVRDEGTGRRTVGLEHRDVVTSVDHILHAGQATQAEASVGADRQALVATAVGEVVARVEGPAGVVVAAVVAGILAGYRPGVEPATAGIAVALPVRVRDHVVEILGIVLS